MRQLPIAYVNTPTVVVDVPVTPADPPAPPTNGEDKNGWGVYLAIALVAIMIAESE